MPEGIEYSYARPFIRSGDLALVRAQEGQQTLIGRIGRSFYRHAMTCAWRIDDQDTLLVPESREGRGGQIPTLSSQVRRFPRLIDIYTPSDDCPETLRRRAATIAINWSGHGYNYPGIAKNLIAHYVTLQKLAEALGYELDLDNISPSEWAAPKFCSQFHVWAYRWAKLELLTREKWNWDPVWGLNEEFCQPADLARSGSYRLKFRGLVI